MRRITLDYENYNAQSNCRQIDIKHKTGKDIVRLRLQTQP